MAFDFMKNFMMFDDDERFANLCDALEEAVRAADCKGENYSESEVMQALDYLGFSLFRDDWEEFKKMEFPRELGANETDLNKGRRLIH